MATRDSRDGQIQFDKLGGLNERPAPNATPSPDFTTVHALYQRNAGSLQRLEGTKTLALLPSGVGVQGMAQLDDGTGNVVVQGDNGTEYLFTLDELFQRSPVNTLVYEPLPDDNDMPTAIITQTANNGTDIATIGTGSANTWAQRALDAALELNEDSIVTTYAANQFELAPGTYRFRGWVNAAVTLAVSGGAQIRTAEAGFQAIINDVTASATAATGSSESVKFDRNTTAASNVDLGPVNIKSFFDCTYTFASVNHTFEIQNAFSSTLVAGATITVTGGAASNVSTAINGAAVRGQFVRINVAKVS